MEPHLSQKGRASCPVGRGGAGERSGKGNETAPRHIPGAPQRGPSHSPSFPPWEQAGTTTLTAVGFSDPDCHP